MGKVIRIAAIDIGSNAIRLQVNSILPHETYTSFKKLEYVRFPLRLGEDVFYASENGVPNNISEEKCTKFLKLMQAFKLLIDLYEVDDYLACATSAIRESANGQSLVDEVKSLYDLDIKIIDGNEEADIIIKAIAPFLDEHTYLHIDVGGGSTELSLFVNHEKVISRSFTTGSVRRLGPTQSPEIWQDMQRWVKENVKRQYGKVTVIGTGGNINKLYDLANAKKSKYLSLGKIKELREFLASHTFDERVSKLELNPDRADVIVPASDIYISVMEWAGSSKIIVPDVGLKDGMIRFLYERNGLEANNPVS